MAINYAVQVGNIVKIGMQASGRFHRLGHYKSEVIRYAFVYDADKPAEVKVLWLHKGLSPSDARKLEVWMIEALRPHYATGNEWFYASPAVLSFMSEDPVKLCLMNTPSGYLSMQPVKDPKMRNKKYEDMTIEELTTTMMNLIILTFNDHGDMTQNRCRRHIHPERRGIAGVSAFRIAFSKLTESKTLVEAAKTQRSIVYHFEEEP
jgi:hypothetical protein